MTEFEFCSEVLREPLWVGKLNDSSFHDRPKLISALRKLLKRAGNDLDDLGKVHVFSPSENAGGMFQRDPPQEPLIYLSPCLDKRSQAFVDYTVAHEFAHAVEHATRADHVSAECVCGAGENCICADCKCMGCHDLKMERTPDDCKSLEDYVNWEPEYAADSLVLEWGFKLPAWKAKHRVVRVDTDAVAEPV